MKLTSSTSLAIGLGVLVIGGIGIFVIPQAVRAQRLSAEISEYQTELDQPNVGEAAISQLVQRRADIKHFGDERITPIPDAADLAGLMRELSAMFTGAGLDAPQLTTGVPEEAEGAMSLPLTVVAEGPFLPIAEMVDRIESLPRLVRVQRLRIASPGGSRSGEVDRSGIVRADILLDVFYAPTPATAGEQSP